MHSCTCLHSHRYIHMGWLWLVGSIKLQVSFAKEPYTRDNILQKRPIILSILLTVATPYRYIQECILARVDILTYMHIHTYIYIRGCILARVDMFIYIYIYIYTHIHIQKCILTRVYIHMCIHIYIQECISARVDDHIYIYICCIPECILARVDICIDIYIHIQECIRVQGGEDSQNPLSLQVIFCKSDLYLVALLWKMICN